MQRRPQAKLKLGLNLKQIEFFLHLLFCFLEFSDKRESIELFFYTFLKNLIFYKPPAYKVTLYIILCLLRPEAGERKAVESDPNYKVT